MCSFDSSKASSSSLSGLWGFSSHRESQFDVTVSSLYPDDEANHPSSHTDEEIVDTNSAVNAFAGGLLGALAAGKSWDEAVEAARTLGAVRVAQVEPQHKWPRVEVL